MYLPVSDNPSVIETSVDSEQDVCCDAEEKEKMLHTCKMSSSAYKLSVAPEMDILEYSKKEWRGNTPVAKSMRKGYEAVARKFASISFLRTC